tara:strand:- start:2387 stop:2809 length:423 start_codon:yes stop_codon:yes gene_type:complete
MEKSELLQKFNDVCPNTLMETLGIKYIDVDPINGMLKASMPVNPTVHQPMGLLHGGASVALAESVGSAASSLFSNPKEFAILGLEISCNHIKSVKEGMVYAQADIIHKGRSTHIWEIKIVDENSNLISHCKLTNIIKPLK